MQQLYTTLPYIVMTNDSCSLIDRIRLWIVPHSLVNK